MKSFQTPRMEVVKREEKEVKLTTFIASQLAQTLTIAAPLPWLLVARSADSPVVKALNALAPAIAAAGLTVDSVFTQPTGELGAAPAHLTLAFGGSVRVTTDVRLLDAHELLRFDGETSWTGDCMRRDPAKRDAYECYAGRSPEAADWCHKTFERLCAKADAAGPTEATPVARCEPAPLIDGHLSSAALLPATTVVSTRH